jgi:uncharacterized protein (TIGR02118 family)
MRARFVAVYETPADPEAFDRHYRDVHVPLARRLPGLRSYTLSRDVVPLRGEPYYLVAELDWDSLEELQAAFASAEGAATAADAAQLGEMAVLRSMIFTLDDVTYAPLEE